MSASGPSKAAASGHPTGGPVAWAVVVLLGMLYLVSFVDRFVLALLVEPLKQDLGVSEVQLGLLFGTAFAFAYAIIGVPLARLADRGNRRAIILTGALLWSFCTIGSAFVSRYEWLVALRLGLAVGEAALTPSVFSMIGDLFPANRRARAASVYSAFGMLGAGGSSIIGGLVIWAVAHHAGPSMLGPMKPWQMVFLWVGTPSLLLTIVVAIVVREPRRLSETAVDQAGASTRIVLDYALPRWRFFASIFLGAGLCQTPAYAMVAWMPHILAQRFGVTPASAGIMFGTCAILATVLGTLSLPMLTDRFGGRWGPVAAARFSGCAAIAAVLSLSLAAMSGRLALFLGLSSLGLMLLTGAANNILASLQRLVPAQMRATFASFCLLSITLVGLGIGPPLLAALRSNLTWLPGPGPAIAVLALFTSLPAGWLLLTTVGRTSAASVEPERNGEPC